ncbi:unnamed protein product, partial [Mesorhabditis spiculigera]
MVRLYRGSRITEMLEAKKQVDDQMSIVDRTDWYVPRESLLSERAAELFYLSFFDTSTQRFLDDSFTASNSMCLQTWYALASTLLSLFVTKTSSNGLLNRGGMHIFSSEQLREFLGLPVEWNRRGKAVLDLGAGDGGVTARTAEFYEHVYATEMSTVMQYRLRQRGYTVLDVSEWQKTGRSFDLITVLNLLDRHYDPLLLLSELHEVALRNGCPVLMAIVLPIRQYVEFHPNNSTTRPDNWIPVKGRTFEEHVGSLIEKVFEPAGFEVTRWTKMPYLCEGDHQRPYYVLFDALFLLKAVPKTDTGHNQNHRVTEVAEPHIEL